MRGEREGSILEQFLRGVKELGKGNQANLTGKSDGELNTPGHAEEKHPDQKR